MGSRLTPAVVAQFIASWKRQTYIGDVSYKVKGVDMDAFARKFRIMEKVGLMACKDNVYTATTKGKLFALRQLQKRK